MTNQKMFAMSMMSCHASASSADAASYCAQSAGMHAASNSIIVILDAIIMASIIIIALVDLAVLRLVLVLLVGLLVCSIIKLPRLRKHV